MRVYDAEGHEHPNTEALQIGRVWQAEEVREGDCWRRYYGFVGRHALTRVAAEEIDFPAPRREGWSSLSTDLDCRIVIKEAATAGPMPVELSFRNHHGVQTAAPAGRVIALRSQFLVTQAVANNVRLDTKPQHHDRKRLANVVR